ncbi:MAG TPA: CapA family protein [Thermoanaerobaculia bacterium]|nr:CapA family protein [Thermoanaerobaculia bacterium]
MSTRAFGDRATRSAIAAAALAATALSTLSAANPREARTARPPDRYSIALAGDTILTRPLSGRSEPDFLALLDLLRGADAAFTNLETLFHDFEGPAMPSKPSLRSDPRLARELAWAGFDLVARANNHASDYGSTGMEETTRHVAAAGIAQAGVGESLAQARRAALFHGPTGTVALVSVTSTFSDFARAGNPRGRIPARPGVNPLRIRTTYVVPPEELETLRRVARELDLDPPAEGALDLGGMRLTPGPRPETRTESDPADLEAIAAEVRRASPAADYTIVSIHCHEWAGRREAPPAFLSSFAHAMIDAGADIVVGQGPHVLRGVEIYRGRPIFYSLGNFLFEYETVAELPADDYESVNLPPTARPDDFFDRYDQGGSRGYPADEEVWESAVAVTRWKGKRLEAVELHPISLGFGLPRQERGRPQLAGADLSRKILNRLIRLSEPFGTRIELADGRTGRVVLATP